MDTKKHTNTPMLVCINFVPSDFYKASD